MRLIDAENIGDFIVEHAEQIQYAIEHKDMELLESLINQIPTAYDIEHKCKDCAGCTLCKCDEANAIQEYINKIVEQLEEEEEESYADFERYAEERGLDEDNDFYSVGMKRAIEIVKGGGDDAKTTF